MKLVLWGNTRLYGTEIRIGVLCGPGSRSKDDIGIHYERGNSRK